MLGAAGMQGYSVLNLALLGFISCLHPVQPFLMKNSHKLAKVGLLFPITWYIDFLISMCFWRLQESEA